MKENESPRNIMRGSFKETVNSAAMNNEGSHDSSTLFLIVYIISVQFSSVNQSCLTLCDPMNRSMPGLPVLAIVNSAAMNIGVHISFNSSFLGVYAQQWNCWVYGSSISSFLRTL